MLPAGSYQLLSTNSSAAVKPANGLPPVPDSSSSSSTIQVLSNPGLRTASHLISPGGSMLIYQIVILALLLLPFGISLRNLFAFAAIRREDRPVRAPRVSVLVPARDEERSIERCVRSLLEQEYDDYEVIVLNDGSVDGTGEILEKLRRSYPALTVLAGEPLPEGWAGKNWACHQLAARATGEWFLFADADTWHAPQSIAATAAFAERHRLGLLSGVPLQSLESFWERAIIPMVSFLYFAYLPNRWITERPDPRFSATNGQLIYVERDAYRRIGGHQAVRSQLVEDIWLGRMAKRAGIRTALATAVETAGCRMYRSLGEIIRGFSKNLFPGLGRSLPGVTLFVLMMLLLYLAPLLFVVAGALGGNFTLALFWLPLVQLGLGMGMRWMMSSRFRFGAAQPLYHPLAALMLAAIAINSVRWAYSSGGTRWKGRRY